MTDEQLRRWAEEQEEARSVHSSMVAAAYLLLFALLGLFALLALAGGLVAGG